MAGIYIMRTNNVINYSALHSINKYQKFIN